MININVSYLLRRLTVLLAIISLAACGGHEKHSAESVKSSLNTSFTIDPATPNKAVVAIVSVKTSVGAFSPTDRSIDLPTATLNNETLVVATNSQDQVLLASYVTTGQPVNLSPTSTAIVMTRIATTPLPDNVSPSQMDKIITATKDFPNLVLAITQSMAEGTSPAHSPTVLQSLNLVTGQVLNAFPAPAATAGVLLQSPVLAGGNSIKLLASTFSLPYELVPTRLVMLDDLPGNGVNLYNNSLIGWTASATDIYGNKIGESKLLTGLDVYNSIASLALNGKLSSPVPLLGNGYQFVVQVSVDNTAFSYNTDLILINFANAVLSPVLPLGSIIAPACAGALMTSLPIPELAALKSEKSGAAMRNYITGLFSPSNINSTVGALLKCSNITGFDIATAALTNFLNPVSDLVDSVKFFVGLSSANATRNQLYLFTGKSFSVTVCKSNGSISPCGLLIVSPSNYLAIGESMQLTVKTRAGETLTQSALTWDTATAREATLTTGGLLTGDAVGIYVVNVRDGVGETAALPITVYLPTISPANSTVSVGATSKMSLVDPTGVTANVGPNWLWSSDNPFVARIDENSGIVTGEKVGEANIIITNSKLGMRSSTKISVTSEKLVIQPYSALLAPGTSVKLTATAKDSTGQALPVSGLQWSSDNPGVTVVDGMVSASTAMVGRASVSATDPKTHSTASIYVYVASSISGVFSSEGSTSPRFGTVYQKYSGTWTIPLPIPNGGFLQQVGTGTSTGTPQMSLGAKFIINELQIGQTGDGGGEPDDFSFWGMSTDAPCPDGCLFPQNVNFVGKINADGIITGTWSQNGIGFDAAPGNVFTGSLH